MLKIFQSVISKSESCCVYDTTEFEKAIAVADLLENEPFKNGIANLYAKITINRLKRNPVNVYALARKYGIDISNSGEIPVFQYLQLKGHAPISNFLLENGKVKVEKNIVFYMRTNKRFQTK